jgi:hypothetical protein
MNALATRHEAAMQNRLAGKLLSRLKSRTMLLADRGYEADWIRALAVEKKRLGQHPDKMQSPQAYMLQPPISPPKY